MKKNQNNKSCSRLALLLLVVIGVYLLLPKLVGFERALSLIQETNKFYLILALLAEIAGYASAAWFLGFVLSKLGHRLSFLDRFRVSSIGAFAIHFLPIASFGEGLVGYHLLKKKGVKSGSVLLMLVLRLIFSYAAFLAIFVIGLGLVPTYPHLSFSPKLVSLLLFILIAAGVSYLIYLYRHKEKFSRVFSRFSRFVNFFLKKLQAEPKSPERTEEVFEELYKGVGIFGRKKRNSLLAFLPCLFYWGLDATCLFFVFLSFGYVIQPGVLIFTYGIATLAGILSFIPGGLGVTEGSLALIFSALGVPFSIALMSVLVFRLFSFWIWIPVGLVSYLSLRRETVNAPLS